MIDIRWWYDILTGALWFALALVGVCLRLRRLQRLRRIVLVHPVDLRDTEYLASIKRSTYLRLAVKVVLLIGAAIAVFDLDWLWAVWRAGLVLALVFMILETTSVDHVRDRLGRSAEPRP